MTDFFDTDGKGNYYDSEMEDDHIADQVRSDLSIEEKIAQELSVSEIDSREIAKVILVEINKTREEIRMTSHPILKTMLEKHVTQCQFALSFCLRDLSGKSAEKESHSVLIQSNSYGGKPPPTPLRAGEIIPNCPVCDKLMIARVNGTTFNEFFACPDRNSCRKTINRRGLSGKHR